MADDPTPSSSRCPPSAPVGERRNLELKARLESLPAARTVAQRLATDRLESQTQIDTYFCCGSGRLKLRQIDGGPSQLVSYARPDRYEVALSQYHLVEVPDGSALKQALAAALGIWVVVRKRREIYLYHNVRIHLDLVDGLGEFLEFEAVLGPDADEPTSQRRLDYLSRQFGIPAEDLLKDSYSDMLASG